jgi:hypothetical protein
MLAPQTPSPDDHAGATEPGPQSPQTDSDSATLQSDQDLAPQCGRTSAPSETAAPSEPPEPPWIPPTYAPAPDLGAAMDEVLREQSLAYELRLTRWRKIADPRTDFEEFLVLIFVNLSFELERAGRAYEEQLRSQVESAVENERLKVHELSKMLFDPPCGSGATSLYALWPYVRSRTRTSSNSEAKNLHDPAVVVMEIEQTGAGCRHLRQIWTDLRARIEPHSCWQAIDRLRCIRMCGCNPVDALEDRRVAEIYAAAYAHGQNDDHAWVDLLSEMGKPALQNYRGRVRLRYPDLLYPSEKARGKTILIDLCEENIARLSAKIEMFDAKTREKAEQTVARLGFDHSPEGERISRTKTACKRDFFKAIDVYKKIRSKRNSIAGGRGESEPTGSSPFGDDSVASVIAQGEKLLRAFQPEEAPAARSTQPPIASPPVETVAPQAVVVRAQAGSTPSTAPSPPTPRDARPPTPTIPGPDRPAVMNPSVSTPDSYLSTLGSNSPFLKMNASIQKLLATSPEAMEYLQSFLTPVEEKPGARDGAG